MRMLAGMSEPVRTFICRHIMLHRCPLSSPRSCLMASMTLIAPWRCANIGQLCCALNAALVRATLACCGCRQLLSACLPESRRWLR